MINIWRENKMIQKYREETTEYDVTKHGDQYSPQTCFGVVCPECCSTDITIRNDSGEVYEHMSYNNFHCENCGCEFSADRYFKLNEKGKKLHKFLDILIPICVIISGIFMILAFWFGFHHNNNAAIISVVISVIIDIIISYLCRFMEKM